MKPAAVAPIAALLTGLIVTLAGVRADAKIQKGDAFPFVSLPALEGTGRVDLAKYKGKTVLVDLWASWCGPCKDELPFLNALAKKHKDLVVIAVNLDDKKDDAHAFLKAHPVQLSLAFDGEKKVLVEKVDVEALPTSFLIDKKGVVAARHESFGPADASEIEAEVAALLKRK